MDTVRISGKNSQVSPGAVEVVPAKPRRGGLPFKLLMTAVLGLTLVSVAAPTASLAPIAIGSEAFDARFGHIQGACCTDDAIYLTQMKCLYKFDWSGKLLKKQSVISHTGDICFWKGEIYTSVSVYEGPNKGKGMIQVFDQELNMVRETLLDRGTDGITILDGVLYLGMGSNHVPSKDPHRENWVGFFDPKTLKPVRERTIIDFGALTHYGIQDISSDGKNILWCDRAVHAKDGNPFVAYEGAELIVTSTFHGTAYAVNHRKNFVVLTNHNDKVEELLRLFHLEDRMIHSADDIRKVANKDIDYTQVNETLRQMRERSFGYLESALETNKDCE